MTSAYYIICTSIFVLFSPSAAVFRFGRASRGTIAEHDDSSGLYCTAKTMLRTDNRTRKVFCAWLVYNNIIARVLMRQRITRPPTPIVLNLLLPILLCTLQTCESILHVFRIPIYRVYGGDDGVPRVRSHAGFIAFLPCPTFPGNRRTLFANQLDQPAAY